MNRWLEPSKILHASKYHILIKIFSIEKQMISFPVQSIVFVSFVHVKITGVAVELYSSVNRSARLLGMLLFLTAENCVSVYSQCHNYRRFYNHICQKQIRFHNEMINMNGQWTVNSVLTWKMATILDLHHFTVLQLQVHIRFQTCECFRITNAT